MCFFNLYRFILYNVSVLSNYFLSSLYDNSLNLTLPIYLSTYSLLTYLLTSTLSLPIHTYLSTYIPTYSHLPIYLLTFYINLLPTYLSVVIDYFCLRSACTHIRKYVYVFSFPSLPHN